MDIYWIERKETKQRRGPLPDIEIISMLERGDLSPEVKGWHQGCEQWVPLRELPILEAYFEKKERGAGVSSLGEDDLMAPNDLSTSSNEDVPKLKIFVAPPLAWRFWARLFDCVLYGLVYFAVVRLFADQYNPYFFYSWLWLPMPFIEACLLAWWGTTPGKFLMGIQVRYCKGEKLGFLRAFRRSLSVLFFGFGMMATILTPVCIAFSWWYMRRHGISLWDRRVGSIAEMKNGGRNMVPGIFWRILLLVILLFVMMQAIGTLMLPWLSALEATMRQMGM